MPPVEEPAQELIQSQTPKGRNGDEAGLSTELDDWTENLSCFEPKLLACDHSFGAWRGGATSISESSTDPWWLRLWHEISHV